MTPKTLGPWTYDRKERCYVRLDADGEVVSTIYTITEEYVRMYLDHGEEDRRTGLYRWSIKDWLPPSKYWDVAASSVKAAKKSADARLSRLGWSLSK